MANGRVVATGAVPGGSLSAQAGGAIGRGFGVGVGGMLGQGMAERRAAKQLNPLREALMASMPQDGNLTPQQQMIAAAVQDPRMFARLAQSPQGALQLAEQMQPQAQFPDTAFQREIVVRHDSELNERYGLNLAPGDTATVKLNYDAQGNQLPGFSIEHFSRAKEATGEDSGPFGASVKGRSLGYLVNYAEGFATGELTPEQERVFLTSVTDYRQPEFYTDPDTGLRVERRSELPDFAVRALRQRGYTVTEGGIVPPVGGDPVQLARQPSEQATLHHEAMKGSMPTIPEDALPEPKALDNPTIYEIISAGDIAGPSAATSRFLHGFAGIGEVVPGQERTEAGREVSAVAERITRGLQQNPRYAEGEASRLRKQFENIAPGALRSTSGTLSEVIGVDRILARIEDEMHEVVTGRRALVPGETRQHAMSTLQFVRYWRNVLVPPRVAPNQLDEYARTANPGAKVLVERSPQDREVAHVFSDQKRAEAFAESAPTGTVIYVNGERFVVER